MQKSTSEIVFNKTMEIFNLSHEGRMDCKNIQVALFL